ncbi:sulfate adenylate transferase subunit 2 (plasmid) [Allorhizobium ampelinum S4]|uniref:Sulfate adenylyltransferase subunit 2 n=1 Tax=Allorhizobium ampelinum (strain ATCC BAA-846 / DSM 112012 / S4) TaxID=311402 RepID=B9K394_ALLAM|nr:sulfate adenylate transferase subunit 2 [Allorhizobium ampelinum S4]
MSQPHHLDYLEAEAINIFREVIATFERPVILYSVGKDSSVLLHIAQKAVHPARLEVPLLHIDTTWKFKEMIAFRDETAVTNGLKLIVHTNHEAVRDNINPFEHTLDTYTHQMKTIALRQALEAGGFDAAVGGARRDEEKSRAKERIFSLRSFNHSWDPKNQRPEMWNIFNTNLSQGQTMRVFPLSNWTELDIWEYISCKNIPIVSLYTSAQRPVVRRGRQWIVVDDERFILQSGETPEYRNVRFRTLGCYPLTAAVESNASSVKKIIREMKTTRMSERQGRIADSDPASSMERKKREGYF